MTREDIDRALESFARVAEAIERMPGAFTTAEVATTTLARVVAEQERRLRVLEPCPPFGLPHEWAHPSLSPSTCNRCGVRR